DAMYAYDSKAEYAIMPQLSSRNAASSLPTPWPTQSSGDEAEMYEITQYNARIETRNSERSREEVSALKEKEYVIFESANTYGHGCDFSFKVRHANVHEVVSFLEAMDPKELSENTYTIKSQIDDFTSEV